MKDPEFRKARLVELRIQNARTYPGVARELGLSEKEANQLFELLAENQLKMADELVTRNADPGTTTTALQQRTARQEEQEGSIRAMLGGKYSQWQDYQQSLPARYQVFSMGSTLAAAGVPLTDSQAKALTGVMIADQQQQKLQPPPAVAQSFNPADPRPRGEQILEESQRRAEETNRRTLDAVAPNLSAKQLATMKELFEQENNARRETLSRLPRPQAAPQRP